MEDTITKINKIIDKHNEAITELKKLEKNLNISKFKKENNINKRIGYNLNDVIALTDLYVNSNGKDAILYNDNEYAPSYLKYLLEYLFDSFSEHPLGMEAKKKYQAKQRMERRR